MVKIGRTLMESSRCFYRIKTRENYLTQTYNACYPNKRLFQKCFYLCCQKSLTLWLMKYIVIWSFIFFFFFGGVWSLSRDLPRALGLSSKYVFRSFVPIWKRNWNGSCKLDAVKSFILFFLFYFVSIAFVCCSYMVR